ncbi:MAG: hypothetical protein K1V72_06835 [Duncaniella sp.]|jgi:DNA/RNA-binding domain of Phe-tRNA-synthetase-like protein
MEIRFDDTIRGAAPGLTVVTVEADVTNVETSDELWSLLVRACDDIRSVTELSDINKRPGIKATRDVYKALGKEPNRYRPSSEALCRRAVKGKELYRINALVDLINVLSLLSGYSIGGFDASKIDGDVLTLGVGREGEPFEAIGRGMLNICGMPVYRDNTGGIGTPTSDNERTKLDLSTTRLLMCINIYGEEMPADDVAGMAVNLLEKYAEANNITINYFRP